jgi:Mrp family chromosome partitioning ATPase
VADLIQQFSRRADVVVIDTPPALATPDMAQLSRLVDVVLVVVRQGRESRRSLQALHRQSQSWHKAISGVVVTDSDADEAYGYYAARSPART